MKEKLLHRWQRRCLHSKICDHLFIYFIYFAVNSGVGSKNNLKFVYFTYMIPIFFLYHFGPLTGNCYFCLQFKFSSVLRESYFLKNIEYRPNLISVLDRSELFQGGNKSDALSNFEFHSIFL